MAIGSGRFRGGRLLAILGVGWMLYTLVAGQQGLLAIRELRAERDRLRAESTALGDEIAALETRLAETSDDPHRLERVAREVYGLARPGETVYRITPVSSSGSMP
jgi:cell division protein FtsB